MFKIPVLGFLSCPSWLGLCSNSGYFLWYPTARLRDNHLSQTFIQDTGFSSVLLLQTQDGIPPIRSIVTAEQEVGTQALGCAGE